MPKKSGITDAIDLFEILAGSSLRFTKSMALCISGLRIRIIDYGY